jgi:hypothetical protein
LLGCGGEFGPPDLKVDCLESSLSIKVGSDTL